MSATLTTPKTTSGGEIVRELVNASDGAGLHFDGASGSISGTSNLALGSKYSAEFVVNYTGSADNRLFDINGDTRFIVEFNRTGFTGKIAGYDSDFYEICDIPDDGVFHIVVTVDGTAVSAYVNGNLAGTAAKNNSTSIDTVTQWTIGANVGGSGSEFEGTIYRARFWNKVVDAKALYERADVDFADQYGSQTELVINGDFASATGWSKGDVTVAGDGTAVWAASGNYQYLRRSDWSITKGKKYRITVVTSAHTTNGTLNVMGYTGSPSIATTNLDGDAFTISGTGTHIFEFEALADSSGGVLFGSYPTGAAYVGTMTDISCVQIGAVSDYDLAFANENQSRMVADRSTNNVDGEMSSSGVKQTQVIKQLNSTAMRVGGTSATAATPADGQVIGDKITTTNAIQLERVSEYTAKLSCVDSGGNQTLQILGNRSAGSASSGTDILIGGQQSRTTGYVLKVEQGSDTYLTIDSTGKIGQNCDPEAFMHIQAADASVAPAGTADVAAFEFTAGAGIDGISLLYPDAKTGQIVFGTPSDNDAGRIVYGGPSVTTAADQDAMRFHTAGTEAMRIDSTGLATFSAGIAFTQTNSTAASNITTTLDHYERGVWTPVIADAATGGNTGSGSTVTGYYERIGNAVTVTGLATNVDTSGMIGTNVLYVRGLPFPAGYSSGTFSNLGRAVGSCVLDRVDLSTGTNSVNPMVTGQNSYFLFHQTRDATGDANILVNMLTSTEADLFFSFTYFVD